MLLSLSIEGSDTIESKVGVEGSYDLPNLGARNKTLVLYKSSTRSSQYRASFSLAHPVIKVKTLS